MPLCCCCGAPSESKRKQNKQGETDMVPLFDRQPEFHGGVNHAGRTGDMLHQTFASSAASTWEFERHMPGTATFEGVSYQPFDDGETVAYDSWPPACGPPMKPARSPPNPNRVRKNVSGPLPQLPNELQSASSSRPGTQLNQPAVPWGESDPLPPQPIRRATAAVMRQSEHAKPSTVPWGESDPLPPAPGDVRQLNTERSIRRGSSGPLPPAPGDVRQLNTERSIRRLSSGPLPALPHSTPEGQESPTRAPSYRHLDPDCADSRLDPPCSPAYNKLDRKQCNTAPDYAEPSWNTSITSEDYEQPVDDDDEAASVVMLGPTQPPDGRYTKFKPPTADPSSTSNPNAVGGSTKKVPPPTPPSPPLRRSVEAHEPVVGMGGSASDEIARFSAQSTSLQKYENLPTPPRTLHQYANLDEVAQEARGLEARVEPTSD